MADTDPAVSSEFPVVALLADPASALQRELTPRPSPQDEEEIFYRVVTDNQSAIEDRSEWETRLVEWEDAYYGRVGTKNFPWPGASNFHVPITMMGVESMKPRLVESILGQRPPIIVVPTTAAGEDRKVTVETVLNWQVQSQMKLESIITNSAHLFLLPGLAVAKTYWKVTRTWRKYIREFAPRTRVQDIFDTLFGATPPTRLTEVKPLSWEGEIPTAPRDGPPLAVNLKMAILDDGIQVLVEREVIEEKPHVDLIDPVDLIVPVKGGPEIRDLPWVQHRIWMTEGDLRAKVAAGRFYADTVQDLLDAGTPGDDNPANDAQGYRASQDTAEGVEGQGASNARQSQWAVLEDYRRYDIDDDGIDEDVIFWVCEHAPGKILGWDYLDNVYAHGRCPIRVGKFFPIPFRFYPLSYAEMMRGIQDEINTIHNQKVDAATLTNLPFGFVRASATLPPIQQRIKPGELIPIDNPSQDVLFPKWGGSPMWANQEEATLYQYGERLSGLSDITMGRQPNRVGATRTAKGTQTLLAEGGLRFKIAMQAFQRFWIGIFEDILALDQEHLPPSQEFRITGKQPAVIKVKDRSEIRGNFDLRLAATSDTLNREQMREDATIIMQAVLNPALIQVGIVGMKGVRRTVADLLKAYGRDPDFYLEDQAAIRNPIEELQLFNVGQYVSPVPGENFQMHILGHQAALEDPSVHPEVKQFLRKHIQETYQLMQAQKMAQSMQQGPGGGQGAPPVGQQAQNALMGRQPQGQPGTPSNGTAPPAAGMPPALTSGSRGR